MSESDSRPAVSDAENSEDIIVDINEDEEFSTCSRTRPFARGQRFSNFVDTDRTPGKRNTATKSTDYDDDKPSLPIYAANLKTNGITAGTLSFSDSEPVISASSGQRYDKCTASSVSISLPDPSKTRKKDCKIPVGIAVAWQRLVTSATVLPSTNTMVDSKDGMIGDPNNSNGPKISSGDDKGKGVKLSVPPRPSSVSPLPLKKAYRERELGRVKSELIRDSQVLSRPLPSVSVPPVNVSDFPIHRYPMMTYEMSFRARQSFFNANAGPPQPFAGPYGAGAPHALSYYGHVWPPTDLSVPDNSSSGEMGVF